MKKLKLLFVKIMGKIGFVPISDLNHAHSNIDFIIDGIEAKKKFFVLHDDDIFTDKSDENIMVIAHGDRVVIKENLLKNSSVVTTHKSNNLLLCNNLFNDETKIFLPKNIKRLKL